jgi:hypothetical protein
MIVRLFVFPVKAAMTSPFWRAVSYGKIVIPYRHRNNASDFSFSNFSYDIADRIFNSKMPGFLSELGLVLSGNFDRGVDQSSGPGAILGWGFRGHRCPSG